MSLSNCRIIPVNAASPIFFPDKVDSDRVVMGTKSNPNPIPLKLMPNTYHLHP
jgi:hypothetical protein